MEQASRRIRGQSAVWGVGVEALAGTADCIVDRLRSGLAGGEGIYVAGPSATFGSVSFCT